MARAGSRSPLPSPPGHRRTIPATVVDETVAAAAALLDKWHPDDSACSLFLDSPDEAAAFLRAAADLHRAMLFFASGSGRGGQGLVQAQALLDNVMQRLQLELQLLLSALPGAAARAPIFYDGDDDDDEDEQQSIVDHLRAVAGAMMAAGYGKECVSTFKARRRAAVGGKLQRLLGFAPSPQHAQQLSKLTWEQVDAKMQSWVAGAAVAFRSVFPAERELCDAVFAGDAAVGDAVFEAVASEPAAGLLAVAEAAVARARRGPERMFRVLDVHDALTEAILPAIVPAFGERSEVATRAVALAMTRIGEAARGMVAGFEAAIQKEPAKATTPGGAVHPLTRYVMNYLVFVAEYENAIGLIYQQGEDIASSSVFSGSASASSSSSSLSSLSWNPVGWLASVLLRKLDAKAGSYREPALSYLFLANNTHYVAKKVSGSGKLEGILGEEWAEAQRAKARGYVDVFVRAAWGSKVVPALRIGDGAEEAVMEAVAAQDKWAAADDEMGETLRKAIRAAVVPTYRQYYRRHGAAARLTPGDVNSMIGGLFGGSSDGAEMPQKQDPVPQRQQPQLSY